MQPRNPFTMRPQYWSTYGCLNPIVQELKSTIAIPTPHAPKPEIRAWQLLSAGAVLLVSLSAWWFAKPTAEPVVEPRILDVVFPPQAIVEIAPPAPQPLPSKAKAPTQQLTQTKPQLLDQVTPTEPAQIPQIAKATEPVSATPSTTLDPVVSTPSANLSGSTEPTMPQTPQGPQILDRPPKLLAGPAPTYPPSALRRELEGTVVALITTSPDGSVKQVEILQSAGRDFDRAVISAAQQAKFEAPIYKGQAVSARFQRSYVFSLSD